ncbi:hypothetical protein LWI29_008615 [Acer saccharum]|uniref:Uncharacterized protein n=1 Tax=Acer saccharum TaxID=4024 RepID=A0AA39VRC9_ACESA|nr:hypothetical protein LWI29_008615 [Acer saccharum]
MASVVNSPEARYLLGSDFSLCCVRRAQGDLIGLAVGSLSSRASLRRASWDRLELANLSALDCVSAFMGDLGASSLELALRSLSSRFWAVW